MAMPVEQLGWIPVAGAGVTTPASINAATPITMPAAGTTVMPANGGFLACHVSVEGTSTSRYTTNGTTPTTTVGELVAAPSATVPVSIWIYGWKNIEKFQIIGVAGGNTITYEFYVGDRG